MITTVIAVSGDIDLKEVRKLQSAIGAMLQREQKNLILDWREAEWIAPMAVWALAAQRHEVVQKGGDLKFAGMNPIVRGVFCKHGAGEIFESYQTLEDALESFEEDWANDRAMGVN